MNIRVCAVRIIQQVRDGQSLTKVFDENLSKLADRDHPFVKALCFGVIRHYYQLQCILQGLLKKPFKTKDGDLDALLLCALYELSEMQTVDYAVVSETVNAVKGLKKKWATGLVNAVLRHFLRHPQASQAQCQQNEQAHFNHPQWMVDVIKHDWPEQWQAILQANNEQPPFVLRVNRLQTTVSDYLTRLAEQDIDAQAHAGTEFGIHINNPIETTQLPGFQQGLFSVQDGAAQQAAGLMDLQPGQTVLDACAAPGGKTCLILETEPNLKKVLALDQDAQRIGRIAENLARLKLKNDRQISIQVADFSEKCAWWEGQFFDRILLDVPCTGSGVIRRHPDIKLLRIARDIVALSQRQFKMLEVAWSVLKPGGRLVYATCSVFKAENECLIAQFVQQYTDANHRHSIRLLPGDNGNDGFYYACLEKEVMDVCVDAK